MAHYLVTGGCGFIGSHLCRALLDRGDAVTVLDDLSTGRRERLADGCALFEADANDPEAMARAVSGKDGVFHLAARSSVAFCNAHWREGHVANQTGSVTVFESAARAGGVPVVYASSAAIYGDAGRGAIAETAPARPLTAYGVDKYGTELHAGVAQRVHGVRTVGLRPFNVFGPGQDPGSPYSGVISIFLARMLAGQPVELFGDGLQSRDFVYVSDVVSFFLAAMALDNDAPEVFNVASGRTTSLLDLIEILGRVVGTVPERLHGPARAGDIRFSEGSTRRAEAVLGVRAQVRLEHGLERLVAEERPAAVAGAGS